MGLSADVVEVAVSGSPGAYTFAVTVQSPDTGCDQYADWWEVVTTEGELVHRRVLLHSHTNEQPFTRSGGRVDIQASDVVMVRAHMSTAGYGGLAFQGTVAQGFQQVQPPPGFALDLQRQQPLPLDCAF